MGKLRSLRNGSSVRKLVLAAALGAMVLPAEALAHGSCTAARMRNVANRCLGVARCYIREALGKQDRPSCVAYQLERIERNFRETMIYPDCHPFGDPADIIASLDSGMGSVASLLQLAADRCSRGKMNSAGKLCLRLLAGCEAPAEVDDVPADPACIGDEYALMSQRFDKAEARESCTTVDDEAGVQSAVQNTVDAVVTELDEP